MKIAVCTSSRAEFGILSPLIKSLKMDKFFKVSLLVTGTHLSKNFGSTASEIKNSGFKIDKKINIFKKNNFQTTQAFAEAILKFTPVFKKTRPDLLVLLGDRFEIFSVGLAAYLLKIPIAHIHGGEITEGAQDDAFRHCLTKISQLHFVSNSVHEKRVIQLGENPKSVFNVGSLGVEQIKRLKLLNRSQLEKNLKTKLLKKNFLVTYHPTTLSNSTVESEFNELLKALRAELLGKNARGHLIIFTKSNADEGGVHINKKIEEFCHQYPNNCKVFDSLGQLRYFSLVKQVDCVIGNSSSGIIEVPYLMKPTVNIGDRQLGRFSHESVINCKPIAKDIVSALKKGLSSEHSVRIKKMPLHFDKINVSDKIISALKKIGVPEIKKKFYDI